jgi:hypothetical protein
MSSRAKKWWGLVPALACLPLVAWLHGGLVSERTKLGLGRGEGLESAPPGLAFTTVALGGFRGLIANVLWSRAIRLQDRGEYFELVSLADWITRLQPDNGMVWAMQAWNLAYNLSIQFETPADRWLWVRSGIELLRDQGLRYNPQSVDLYRELAWFYQDKIGSNTDLAHRLFKESWALEMQQALGQPVNLRSLAEPSTDEERSRAVALRSRYKLDPRRMMAIDAEYGPLEWRLPEAHAIYWAVLGLERCRRQDDLIRIRRVIWQNLERSFQRGRLVENRVEGRMEQGPNLDLVDNAWKAYEAMKREEPDKRDYIARGQRNFVREAVHLLYAHNRMAEAVRWFELGRTSFPGFARGAADVDSFVVAEISAEAGEGKLNRVVAILEGMLGQHYRALSLGDEDRANGYALMVRRIWEAYQAREANFLLQLGLPSLEALQARVLDQIRAGQHGFSPALRAAAGLEAPAGNRADPAEGTKARPIPGPASLSPTQARSDSNSKTNP